MSAGNEFQSRGAVVTNADSQCSSLSYIGAVLAHSPCVDANQEFGCVKVRPSKSAPNH